MNLSRRDLTLLFPLAVPSTLGAQPAALPSKVYRHGQIPYTGDANKKGREFFHGPNHSGFRIQMHETNLSAGTQTHDPHKHEHEEIVIVVEGKLRSTWRARQSWQRLAPLCISAPIRCTVRAMRGRRLAGIMSLNCE